MTYKKIIFLILLVAAFLAGIFLPPLHKHNKNFKSQSTNQKTKILVTIKPLYSLVLGLTKNVPGIQTELLLSPPHSPHTFHLKPSDVNKIVQADLIIWVGPELENFLITPLANLKAKTQLLPLIKTAPLTLLTVRQDEHWEPHDHSHEPETYDHNHNPDHDHNHDHDHHDHDHHDHSADSIDPHIWLNTQNARAMVLTISETLQKRDPRHRAIYLKNTQNLLKKIDVLHTQIQKQLAIPKAANKPFLVFHDAYQYFEKEFGLKASGSITLNPQVPLSAKRLSALQASIKKDNIQCIFSEPEFSQNLVQKLLYNTKMKNFELDPLGARIQMKPHQEEEFYFDLMKGLSDSFKTCLITNDPVA